MTTKGELIIDLALAAFLVTAPVMLFMMILASKKKEERER